MSDRPVLTRQTGAAMFYAFIVTLVLFIAAAYFSWVVFQENEQLRQKTEQAQNDVQQMEGQLRIRNQYIEDITEVVGEAGTYEGRAGFNWQEYGGKPDALQNVTVPERYESTLNDFLGTLGLPKDARQLTAALTYIKNRVDALSTQVADAQSNASSLETRVAELQQQISQAQSERRQSEADLNNQIIEQSERFTAQLEEAQTRTDAVNAQNAALRNEKADLQELLQQEAIAFNKRINTLLAQNSALVNTIRLVNPPEEADGTVLSANQAVSRAWVDIGALDMLKRGTRFRVVDPFSGELKANAVVTTLEPHRAELRITDLQDRMNPVVKGDEIRSEVYSPELRRNIYLMGRFSLPYTKPVVEAYLERIGNNVVERLDVGVDLVVVGQDTINEEGTGYIPVSETEEYKRGTELGVEFVRINQIRDLLEAAGSNVGMR